MEYVVRKKFPATLTPLISELASEVLGASSACFLASSNNFSMRNLSVLTNSAALVSAADTARCSSAMACLFTSFTASSENSQFPTMLYHIREIVL
jgi:hypothetical protein